MPKALSDVTIIDFSHLLQGPFATQLLGVMGAKVIKVERPGQGDLFRTMTFNNQWVGGTESPNYLAWNRNKRSIALDLRAPEAKGVVYRMAERADVVVQNFRPGVLGSSASGTMIFVASTRGSSTARGPATGETGPTPSGPGKTC